MNKIPKTFQALLLFFSVFLAFATPVTVAKAGGLNFPPTVLLEEEKVVESPLPQQVVVVQPPCVERVVYYSTPGIIIAGPYYPPFGGANAVAVAVSSGAGSAVSAAVSNNIMAFGNSGFFSIAGQSWPAVTTCWSEN